MSETAEATPSLKTVTVTRIESVSRLFGSFAALRQVSVDLIPGKC